MDGKGPIRAIGVLTVIVLVTSALVQNRPCATGWCVVLTILIVPVYGLLVGVTMAALLQPLRWLPGLVVIIIRIALHLGEFEASILDVALAGFVLLGVNPDRKVRRLLRRRAWGRAALRGAFAGETLMVPLALAISYYALLPTVIGTVFAIRLQNALLIFVGLAFNAFAWLPLLDRISGGPFDDEQTAMSELNVPF